MLEIREIEKSFGKKHVLRGVNLDVNDNEKLVIIGQGRLVGGPLLKMWQDAGLDVTAADKKTEDLPALTSVADVIVSAAGVPGLVTVDMVKPYAVIVDAGVSTDTNGLVGDVAPEVRELPHISITPQKGGVGPLTVSALFENVITAARATIQS